MELAHRFTVPTSIEETWAHFSDIASVAECFPGAQVTSVDADSFSGSVKVKLGPIALLYNGAGTFVEKDDASHRFVVDAKGKDKRGNGTAGALVTLTMAESGSATDVEVLTDLAITGKPAQFGRGVMQDVSDKLLGQFVTCLESRLTVGDASASAPPGEPVTAQPPVATEEPVAADVPVETTPLADAAAASVGGGPAPAPPPAADRQVHFKPGHPQHEDAIDLGATVVPILLKAYGKQIAAALAALLVLRWLVKRRRG
jgi:uncharacterized protein